MLHSSLSVILYYVCNMYMYVSDNKYYYYYNGITQRELSFLLLLWGLSDPRITEFREMPRGFSIKLHSETQVSSRLGMSGGRSPRHAQNP